MKDKFLLKLINCMASIEFTIHQKNKQDNRIYFKGNLQKVLHKDMGDVYGGMENIMKVNGRKAKDMDMELNLIRMEIYCNKVTGFKINFNNDFIFVCL